MKPKPLYRSITFGSGILLMLFICWEWRDSMRYGSWVNAGEYSLENEAAYVNLKRREGPSLSGKFAHRSEHSYSGMRLLPILPPPLFLRGGGDMEFDPPPYSEEEEKLAYHRWIASKQPGWPTDEWILMIPHWLLLLAIALPWSGLLIGRARRIRRARP